MSKFVNKSKKNKDPYPITDTYQVAYNLVDAATVTVTDLCENLSNNFDTHDEGIVDEMTNVDTRKFNSVSVSNGSDGAYPVWLGVDKFHKVRKIFANTNESNTSGFFDDKNNQEYISWSFHKTDLNDQFFKNNDPDLKRLKLFDIKINSSAIYIGDGGGNFVYEHHDEVIKYIDEKYFKDNGIYQKNYPLGLFKFTYGNREVSKSSSFSDSKIHDEKVQGTSTFKDVNYNEFLSNLLNEKQYPTKYIFEKYLIEEFDYKNASEFFVKDKKNFTDYLLKRLPKAIEILKIQTKILFPKKFKEVFELRKNQFEDFIFSIVKDIEPQELNLPTFNRPEKKIVNNNKLWFEKLGLPTVQDTLFDGFKLKSETSLKETVIIPVKNGKYPCYVHSCPTDTGDDDFKYNVVNIVIEGIEGCYLNKNSQGQLVFNKNYQESGLIRDHIKKKTKKIKIDQIDLRNSESIKELEKINFVEELELHGLMSIKSWKSLSKLKSLKKLKLVSCEVNRPTSKDFFENLYSLNKLEEFIIDDSCQITVPLKDEISKNLYPKKLKTYTIEFRENWKKGDEEHPKHKGYGDSGLDFLYDSLPNIYTFPNFEKFKSLEKLKIYNYFDNDQKEGTLFDYEYGFEDYHKIINELCKKSKIKDIWIYGYNFKKVEDLANTRFLDATIEIFKHTDVKINGINKNTLKETYLDAAVSNTDSIVIIDDNCGYNKSKIIEDIQIFKHEDIEYLDENELPLVNIEKIEFPNKELHRDKDGFNSFKSLFSTDHIFRYSKLANTLLKENNYNHFLDTNNEIELGRNDRFIFVKQSYLEKSNKIIFNNIKHVYYFCCRMYDTSQENSPIFWNKKERFKIPKSIKLNSLETLHISCGRKTSFKEIEKFCGKSLKYLVVQDMLVDDFSMPIMPKLEKMVVNYGSVSWDLVKKNNKKLSNFRNFKNVPKLEELDIDIEYNIDVGIEFDEFYINKKLKKLKVNHLHPKFSKEIKKLTSLESLDLSYWKEKGAVEAKDFEFLKSLIKLKEVKLCGGRHDSIFIDFKKLISFLNKNIEAIQLSIVYKEDDHKNFYNCLIEINKKMKNLKKLHFYLDSFMIDGAKRSSENLHDFSSFKFSETSNFSEYMNKKDKLKSTNNKYKLDIDLKNISLLKNLELLDIPENYNFKNKISNENEILNLPKLTRITSDDKMFSDSFLKKIEKRKKNYLDKCKKIKKYKLIKDIYELEGKEYEEIQKLNINLGYGYHGQSAEDILKERKKKK